MTKSEWPRLQVCSRADTVRRGHRARFQGYSLIEMLFVVGLIGTLSAIAIPMTTNLVRSFRIGGDARGMASTMSLAKLRAASTLSRARVHIDLDQQSYHIETRKSGASEWVTEGGTIHLSPAVTLGYGSLSGGPPDTQGAIAQAPQCQDNSDTPIENTACVLFNSRGIPIDSTGSPTGVAAVYITDGMAVAGIAVLATGLTEVWQSPASSATWVRQ